MHPDQWVTDEYYLWRYLDPIVTWAIEYNKYVIIDLHFIGNIQTGAGSEMIDVGRNPFDFSLEFWNKVACYFKNVPNVIYEIYNEPTVISGDIWKESAYSLVDAIRKTGANQLVLVSGIDYNFDLSCWYDDPMDRQNIAYTAHIFPNRHNWEYKYQEIAEKIPLVVTEWGYITQELPTKASLFSW